jgi:hypothetical protein
MQALSGTTRDRAAGARRAAGRAETSFCIAIVSGVDGARFAAVAASEQECLVQIGSYVAEQARAQLWPPSADRVHELLEAGEVAAAVAEYFRHAGERWDAEWLVTTPLSPHPRSRAWSGPVPIPARFAAAEWKSGTR